MDTGIKKRGGLSAKEFRRSASKKAKTVTLKKIEDIRSNGRTNSSRKTRNFKEASLQDILETDELQKTLKESKREYM